MSAKTTKCILKCCKRSVKRKFNINFRVTKNSSFDQCFLICYMVIKPFWKLFGDDFLFPGQNISLSRATLSCKTQNILTLSMLVYYNKNSFLCNDCCWCVPSSSLISFIYCSLISLLPNIVSSEELFRYGTSISTHV